MSFTSIVGSDEKNIVQALKKSLAMIEFDLSGKILDANDNFCQALGYDLSEIKGKHHRIFVDPKEAASPAYAEFWKKLGRGEYDTAQYKRIAKSGEEIWIEATYNPVFRGGKLVQGGQVRSDVTAQGQGWRTITERSRPSAAFTGDDRVQSSTAQSFSANENFLKTRSVTGWTRSSRQASSDVLRSRLCQGRRLFRSSGRNLLRWRIFFR
jgi:methyl-accepting chemotaxis protein